MHPYVKGLLVLLLFLTRRPVFSWGMCAQKMGAYLWPVVRKPFMAPIFPRPFSMKGLSIPSPPPVSERGFRGVNPNQQGTLSASPLSGLGGPAA